MTVEVLRDWERRFNGPVDVNELQVALERAGRKDALGVIKNLMKGKIKGSQLGTVFP